MLKILLDFLIGGTLVSVFAVLGDVLTPKSFAGLFGAAPSVGLATLTLALLKKPPVYAATECRSMLLGAWGLLVYCLAVRWLLKHKRKALSSSLLASPVWFAVTFALWFLFVR